MTNNKGFTLVELMVTVAIIGIIVAIAVPFYVGHKRSVCDRAAEGDLSKLSASLERFNTELTMLRTDELATVVKNQQFQLDYLVGPYYGWGGTDKSCKVLASYDSQNLVIGVCAVNGSRPDKGDSKKRYVFRATLLGSSSGSTVVSPCIRTQSMSPAVGNGMALEYPRPEAGNFCYTSSMIDSTGTIQVPAHINCSSIGAY
jgi:prepilin-type N-terminal cleavage/methylation domain-containing protein